MSQAEAYARFRALHERPGLFAMPNAWDGASAALLAEAGFEALGSSSIAIAFALGLADGTASVSRSVAIDNAALLGRVSGLPINGDLEDGFGPTPDDCVATVEAAIAAGLAGLGIEDTTANPEAPIHDLDAAVARIAAAARVAKGRILLTARTDNYLIHGHADVDESVRRLTAFAEAGADVLFAPGLADMDAIRAVVRAVSPKPVNVVMGPSPLVTLAELEAAGVKRVSVGGALYRCAMDGLVSAAQALKRGDVPAMAPRLTSGDIARFF